MSTSARPRGAVLTIVGLLVLGCGGDGLDRRYPVAGRVTYRGAAVESGIVTFHPAGAGGRVAAGNIAGGRYRLTTLSPGDGAFPGAYQVTVVSKDYDRTAVDLAPDLDTRQGRTVSAARAAKDKVPRKFSSPRTSGLTRVVRRGANRLDLGLVDERPSRDAHASRHPPSASTTASAP